MKNIYHVTLLFPEEGESKDWYFANMPAIFDTFGRERLGINYEWLRHIKLTEKDYINDKCIIRRCELITKKKV